MGRRPSSLILTVENTGHKRVSDLSALAQLYCCWHILAVSDQIEKALRTALGERDKWPEWGAKNRERFERCFKQAWTHSDYADLVRRMLVAT